MLQIRNSIFETNSSSTHSFILQSEKVEDYPASLKFIGRDFDDILETCTTPELKAAYLWTAIFEMCFFYKEYPRGHSLTKWQNYLYDTLENEDIKVEFSNNMMENGFPKYTVNRGEFLEQFMLLMLRPKNLLKFLFGKHSLIDVGPENSSYDKVVLIY